MLAPDLEAMNEILLLLNWTHNSSHIGSHLFSLLQRVKNRSNCHHGRSKWAGERRRCKSTSLNAGHHLYLLDMCLLKVLYAKQIKRWQGMFLCSHSPQTVLLCTIHFALDGKEAAKDMDVKNITFTLHHLLKDSVLINSPSSSLNPALSWNQVTCWGFVYFKATRPDQRVDTTLELGFFSLNQQNNNNNNNIFPSVGDGAVVLGVAPRVTPSCHSCLHRSNRWLQPHRLFFKYNIVPRT